MAESTPADPLGRPASLTQNAPKPGLQGSGARPGPIGFVSPQQMPTGPQTTQELNLVGDFPKPASWTPQKELQQIHADKWFPSALDFLAVAGSGSVAIADTWDFLLKIVKAPNKISRLNVFSHGSTSLIALQGEILADGGNVILAPKPDTSWTQVFAAKAILDPFAKTWGAAPRQAAGWRRRAKHPLRSIPVVAVGWAIQRKCRVVLAETAQISAPFQCFGVFTFDISEFMLF